MMAEERSKFIIAAERRAKRRARKQELEAADAKAHLEPWYEMRRAQEEANVLASVERQRELSGATGEPEAVKPRDPDIVREKRVDNPLSTFAQFLHELESGKLDAGLQRVEVNQTTLLGGFARFHGTEAQNEACARFKKLWEASQIGGARAIDPSVEPVDGGWCNPEAVFEVGADARKEYHRLVGYLDRMELRRLHFVVVGEWGPTSYARWRYSERNPDGRTIAKGQVEIRRIADKVARFMGLRKVTPEPVVEDKFVSMAKKRGVA
jgi:hypothetical protein